MTTETKHTPTRPASDSDWFVATHAEGWPDFHELRFAFDGTRDAVQSQLTITHKDGKQMAIGLPAFIVRACNSHDALVKAVKDTVELLTELHTLVGPSPVILKHIERLESDLAAAQVKSRSTINATTLTSAESLTTY